MWQFWPIIHLEIVKISNFSVSIVVIGPLQMARPRLRLWLGGGLSRHEYIIDYFADIAYLLIYTSCLLRQM